jgi:hypothetical protein
LRTSDIEITTKFASRKGSSIWKGAGHFYHDIAQRMRRSLNQAVARSVSVRKAKCERFADGFKAFARIAAVLRQSGELNEEALKAWNGREAARV